MQIPKEYKKCGSDDLTIINNGPHKELICAKCYKHQAFLSKHDVNVFYQLKENK